MDAKKRRRLEARGWRVGTAEAFLGLRPEEAVLIDMKLALSRSLRERRGARMTQAELARRIGSSQPRVAKAELGDRSVSIELLIKAMLATGATPKEIGRVIAEARAPYTVGS